MFRVFMMGSNNKCSIVEFGPNKSLFSSELSGGHFYLGLTSQISYKRFYVKYDIENACSLGIFNSYTINLNHNQGNYLQKLLSTYL